MYTDPAQHIIITADPGSTGDGLSDLYDLDRDLSEAWDFY